MAARHARVEGIPETLPDHHSAPYSLTEDFVDRLSAASALPDDYVSSFRDRPATREPDFIDIQGGDADVAIVFRPRNTLYSFGITHPGAITLHNYPRSQLQPERDNEIIDLSVVDLVRDRRRGVPRYNDFRQGFTGRVPRAGKI